MLKRLLIVFFFPAAMFAADSTQITDDMQMESGFGFELPAFAVGDVGFAVKVTAFDSSGIVATAFDGDVELSILDENGELLATYTVSEFEDGTATLSDVVLTSSGSVVMVGRSEAAEGTSSPLRVVPGFLSLLPPVIAIVLALVARQVLIALFCGIWIGAVFVYDYNPFLGLLAVMDHYLLVALSDSSHASIIIFSLTLGGMVGLMSKSGGTQGIVKVLSRYARGRRGGQLATWAMGIMIFFDDYANTLIVGNTMRPMSDKLRISREKLSYIVDSTSAPIASIAIISTWVGFEVGLIDDAIKAMGLDMNAYQLFIESVVRSYYAVFALVMVFLIGWMRRDFGPMFKAEVRAARYGKVLSDTAKPLADVSIDEFSNGKDIPLRWYNAIVPIGSVIAATMIGLFVSGRNSLGVEAYAEASAAGLLTLFRTVFGAADSFTVLIWAAFCGSLVAAVLAVSQRILKMGEAIEAWVSGIKSMIFAVLILLLAWGIGAVCTDLKTADYVIFATEGLLSPHWLPVLTFLIAAVIAFSTGSSWSTMTIVVPIIIPLSYKMSLAAGLAPEIVSSVLVGTIGAVLSGAAFGDHCSPISDTTVMSSMASGADHVDHVRTQIPYALVCGAVSCLVGYIPSGYDVSPLISIPSGVILLAVIVFFVGKKVE